MTSRTLDVTINGKDRLSVVFDKVGASAKTAGQSLDQAGRQGEQGFRRVGEAADKSAQRMDRLRTEATAIGTAMGTLGTMVITAGASFRDQQRQVDGIMRAYGNASDQILDMADAMQDLTRYSNDAARESALVASSLATNYDLSAQQIEILIERSADLAQIYGIDLVDAVQRTAGAIRGEGEAAERLSLNMSDAAIQARALQAGIEDWNVPGALSEAEKAAFRFQVFLEDSAYAAGAAGDAAANAGGGFRQFANEAQDAVQALGGFLGPVGQVGAELAPLALAAPVVGAGLANVGRSAAVARVGMSALAAVTSPIALGLASVVGVGALVVENMRRGGEAAKNYESALASLGDTIEWLRLQGDDLLAEQAEDVKANIDDIMMSFEDITAEGLSERLSLPLIEAQQLLNKIVTEDFDTAVNAVDDVMARIDEALRNPNVDQDEYLAWITDMLNTIEVTAEGSNVDEVLNEILTRPLSDFREDADATVAAFKRVTASAAEMMDVFADLPSTLDDLRIDGQSGLASQLDQMHTQWLDAFTFSEQEIAAANATYLRMLPAEDAQAAIEHMAAQTDLSAEKAEALSGAWERVSSVMQSGNIDNVALMEDVNAILSDTTLTVDEQADKLITLSQNLSQYVDQFGQLKTMMVDWLADGDHFLDWWQAFDQVMIDSSGGIAGAGEAWQSFRQDVIPTADAIDDANASFDQVLRTFEQIDQLASRPAKAQSIVEALIGEPGEWAAIDDLLEAGRIGVDQYNASVASGVAITDSVAQSQLILNEIRADQLPLLEQETLAYQQNLEAIAALEPAEQRRVLMLQDTAVQAQVAELYSTAYAASLGQIPPEVATQMILNAADADAGLKDLLLNLGLISEVDGEIRVNFPDADQTIQAIDRVTQSVLMLADLMDNQKLDGSIKLTIEGDEELNELYGDLVGMDEKEVETTVKADVSDADVDVSYIQDKYGSLDGSEANLSVNADISGAASALLQAAAQRDELDGTEAVIRALGDNVNALGAIGTTRNELAGLDGSTATVTINAINNAGAAIGSVASALYALDGQSATVTTNYVSTYSSVGVGPTAQHGGIPSYATGGVVVRAAEGDRPEIAHFANGGTAVLPFDGLYSVPPMTYISPNNSSTSYGGDTYYVDVTVAGNMVGNDDFADDLAARVVTTIAAVKQRRDIAKGVA